MVSEQKTLQQPPKRLPITLDMENTILWYKSLETINLNTSLNNDNEENLLQQAKKLLKKSQEEFKKTNEGKEKLEKETEELYKQCGCCLLRLAYKTKDPKLIKDVEEKIRKYNKKTQR